MVHKVPRPTNMSVPSALALVKQMAGLHRPTSPPTALPLSSPDSNGRIAPHPIAPMSLPMSRALSPRSDLLRGRVRLPGIFGQPVALLRPRAYRCHRWQTPPLVSLIARQLTVRHRPVASVAVPLVAPSEGYSVAPYQCLLEWRGGRPF